MKAFKEDDETVPSQKKKPKHRSPLRPKTIHQSVKIRNLFVSSAGVDGNTEESKYEATLADSSSEDSTRRRSNI